MVKLNPRKSNIVENSTCRNTKKIVKQRIKDNQEKLQKLVDLEQEGIMDYQAVRIAIGDVYMNLLYAEQELREIKK